MIAHFVNVILGMIVILWSFQNYNSHLFFYKYPKGLIMNIRGTVFFIFPCFTILSILFCFSFRPLTCLYINPGLKKKSRFYRTKNNGKTVPSRKWKSSLIHILSPQSLFIFKEYKIEGATHLCNLIRKMPWLVIRKKHDKVALHITSVAKGFCHLTFWFSLHLGIFMYI